MFLAEGSTYEGGSEAGASLQVGEITRRQMWQKRARKGKIANNDVREKALGLGGAAADAEGGEPAGNSKFYS